MALPKLGCIWPALLMIILSIIWTSSQLQAAASRSLINEKSMVKRHEQWMAKHRRVYKDETEKAQRFEIFKANVERIETFNAQSHSFKLGANQFADLTNDEFRARNGFKLSKSAATKAVAAPRGFKYANVTAVPIAMDWRIKGAVTPIKDQGQCGCCWAFSAVAATEGLNKLTTGKLVSLSEQELVDCDITGEDEGCDGGLMDTAFHYIIRNRGLTTEANYPYQGIDDTCNRKKAALRAASIRGYEDVPADSEASLLKAVANQPVSVAIESSGFDFQMYASGIFTGECGTDLDHGVTAVGYGMEKDGTKYWLVKNSWGLSWGEQGYIRMKRDVKDKQGLCGIAMKASYPTAA